MAVAFSGFRGSEASDHRSSSPPVMGPVERFRSQGGECSETGRQESPPATAPHKNREAPQPRTRHKPTKTIGRAITASGDHPDSITLEMMELMRW